MKEKTILREEQRQQVELKPLPSHLRYEFLENNKNLPVIVNADLNSEQVAQLLPILGKYRKVIGYLMTHKYRGSQQSSREVKPKFIDLTQGEPKNIYKP
jgi:hypothetical protein